MEEHAAKLESQQPELVEMVAVDERERAAVASTSGGGKENVHTHQ